MGGTRGLVAMHRRALHPNLRWDWLCGTDAAFRTHQREEIALELKKQRAE